MNFNHKQEHIDEGMMMIQANLDDMSQELCSFVMDKLFDHGANDVFWVPIVMKKGRPGLMLNVYADESKLEKMKSIIFQETTTLGLRYWSTACHRLGRQWVKVNTKWGSVSVKLGLYDDKVVQYAPEFSECEVIAKQFDIPLKTVYDAVRQAYADQQ